MFRGNLQCLCPIVSGPVTGHNWKDLDSVFTHSLDQIVCDIEVLIRFPWDFSSLTWTGRALSAFPYRREASVPLPSSYLHWPVHSVSMSYAEEPRAGHNTPAVSSPGLSRGEGSPPSTCCPQPAAPSPALAQDTISFLCHQGALLAHSHVVACLFCQAGFQKIGVQCILVHFLLKFIRFPSGHLSRLLRSVWMPVWPFGISATSPSFVSPANLQNEHSTLSCRLLVKML